MINYSTYYRQHGIRRLNQLLTPVLSPIEMLTLPQAAVLHSYTGSEHTLCIDQNDFLLRHLSGTIYLENQVELANSFGHPRKMFNSSTRLLSKFYRANRRMRVLTDRVRQLHNSNAVLVENYDLLPHFYRYNASQQLKAWNEWANVQSTIWKTSKEICNELPNRQQFIVMHLPKVMPTWMQLMRMQKTVNNASLRQVHEPEALTILDLFDWLGDNRDKSLLQLDEKELNQINLIWVESGHWIMVNLGYLDNWRKGKPEEHEEGEEEVIEGDGKNPGSVSPQTLQKRFLRMLMFLFELRTDMSTTPVDEDAPVATADDTNADEKPVAKVGGTVGFIAKPEDKLKTSIFKAKIPLAEPVHVTRAVDGKIGMQEVDEAVSKDLEALDKIIHASDNEIEEEVAAQPETPKVPEGPRETIAPWTGHEVSLEDGILKRADVLARSGRMSGAEHRRAQKLAVLYKTLPDPRGGEGTLEQAGKIDLKVMTLENVPKAPDLTEVFDKSMLHSVVHEFDAKYIKHVFPKDITNSVLAVQKAGIAVTRYTVERHTNAGNDYEEHSVRLEPLQGNKTTIKFRVPVVKPNGTFIAGGVKYRQRKQRGDLPIRKVGADQVALTSYYGKLYINRGQKVVNNYANWLINRMLSSPLIEKPLITDVAYYDIHLPKDYTTIASKFRSFTAKGFSFVWDYLKRVELLKGTRTSLKVIEGMDDEYVLVGRNDRWDSVLMGKDGLMYVHRNGSAKGLEPLGTMEDFLEIEAKKIPMDIVEMEVSGKTLPVAIVLCYLTGFHGLLKHLNVPYRHQAANMRLNLEKGEFAIRFEDESYIFNRRHQEAAMILGGLNSYDTTLRHYAASSLDLKDTYYNILDDEGLGVRFLREMDLLNDMFVDPITLEILKELHDPIDFIGLVFKAVELLKDDWSPEETDLAYMRVKGYERVAGTVYTELVRAIRLQRSRPGMAGSVIEMPPFAIWQSIVQDPAVSLVEESNPVHNLKEKEELTYAGTGGRSSRSMVKRTRVFHPNDVGVISEATKDSSDVAITTFMTADPNLKNLRGMTERWDKEKHGPAKVLSTSALLAPAADRDDPKRVNFISIQNSSGISAVGYTPTPLRTGYEEVMAHRTDDLFAKAALQDGKVDSVTEKSIQITYKDGTSETVELGRRFGIAAGVMTPHDVATLFKEGDKIKKGDIVAYNTHFFQPNRYNDKQVLWKAGVMANVTLMDNVDTLEDSDTISESLALKMATVTTKVRSIKLAYDQMVHGLVKLGDKVEAESILCTIENPTGSTGSLFSEDSLETLNVLAKQNPRAKKPGVVEKIEVFYHGDVDQMSESLQTITRQSDSNRRALAKELGQDFTSGRVDDTMRFEGDPLTPETMMIQIYITGLEPMGIGDKLVVANQMKSIVSRVVPDGNRSESGRPSDCTFAFTSLDARIVNSPLIIGTTNTNLEVIGKMAADIYFGNA
jgi:hypothetical protein